MCVSNRLPTERGLKQSSSHSHCATTRLTFLGGTRKQLFLPDSLVLSRSLAYKTSPTFSDIPPNSWRECPAYPTALRKVSLVWSVKQASKVGGLPPLTTPLVKTRTLSWRRVMERKRLVLEPRVFVFLLIKHFLGPRLLVGNG